MPAVFAARVLASRRCVITTIDFSAGWQVLQDVHGAGERMEIYRPGWNPYQGGPALSGWEPLPRLAHLQLLFADQPYFGRELRQFNHAPWWYRLEFPTPQGAAQAALQFEGVDYFAKVWLNGELLGEHEGYFDPFSFEVGPLLRRDGPNVLIVKVSSPWDTEVWDDNYQERVGSVIRHLLKGTYEHADTFVQRDVNPVGIWRPVRLIVHNGIRAAGEPVVRTRLSEDAREASVAISWPVAVTGEPRVLQFRWRILADDTGRVAHEQDQFVRLGGRETVAQAALVLASPRLWSTWDRGEPALYRAELALLDGDQVVLSAETTFGIRTVELRRTVQETTFLLNGKSIFLRGTTYFPDIYLSNLDAARYQRDLAAIKQAGMNAVRVHVHVENPEFYALCDRMGIAVIQDTDLNWVFPKTDEFAQRAVASFGALVRRLRNRPSIIAWILMNEAWGAEGVLGPPLLAEARLLDPDRPTILNSCRRDDPESGDGHDYKGSLGGGHYLEIYGTQEKLSTEFGIDAPAREQSLRLVARVHDRLAPVLPRLAELHDYCYRLVKYFIEHYRIQKYAPCSGYFQFMWIDLCPQSFYGVYDYWGFPKTEGLGGALRALQESNQPIGIFLEHTDHPIALWAVNDLPHDLGECLAEWSINASGAEGLESGAARVALGPDSREKIVDLALAAEDGVAYNVTLTLRGPDGALLARNTYPDAFNAPPHPEGHPQRMDHELGMRLWWA